MNNNSMIIWPPNTYFIVSLSGGGPEHRHYSNNDGDTIDPLLIFYFIAGIVGWFIGYALK